MHLHNKKQYVNILIVCLLLILFITACSTEQTLNLIKTDPTVTPIPEEPVEVARTTYTVERGTITRIITFSGRLGPIVEQQAAFESSGRVGDIFYTEGDMIQAGDLIASLDYLADLQRENRLNEISLRKAEISVERAQYWLDDANAQRSINEAAVKSREWDLELAELTLEELQIRLGEQKEAAEGAMLLAPISGQISDLSIRVGQNVESFKSVVSIADISETNVLVDSYSLNSDDLSEAMNVSMVLSQKPEDQITGFIRQMPYPFGSGPGRDTNKNIYIEMDNPSYADSMKIGDRFDIELITATSEDTLWLPPAAIREFGGRTFVMIQDGDMQRSVDIQLGIKTGDMVEVLEGLEEGQIVVGQ